MIIPGNGYTVLRVQDRLNGKVAWSSLKVIHLIERENATQIPNLKQKKL